MINLFNKVDKDSQLYKTRTDIMRYKNNSISFWFCVLAIVLNVLMFFVIYHNNNSIKYITIIVKKRINDIIINDFFPFNSDCL